MTREWKNDTDGNLFATEDGGVTWQPATPAEQRLFTRLQDPRPLREDDPPHTCQTAVDSV